MVADYRYSLSKAPAWYRAQLLAFLTLRLGVPHARAAASLAAMEAANLTSVREAVTL